MVDTRDTRTTAMFRTDESLAPPASGNWDFGYVEAKTGNDPAWFISAAACAGFLMSSYVASADLSVDFPSSRAGETVESVIQPIAHRRISIAEALRLSRHIIERAEAGRQKAADDAASRTFELELDS